MEVTFDTAKQDRPSFLLYISLSSSLFDAAVCDGCRAADSAIASQLNPSLTLSTSRLSLVNVTRAHPTRTSHPPPPYALL